MEFIDRFNTDLWCTSDPGKHAGFVLYTVIKGQAVKPGQFQYAVQQVTDSEDDVEFNMVTLDGASGKNDPLQGIRNAEFLIKDGAIVGINVEGDCVVRKNL